MRTILPHQQIKEDFVRGRELLRKIYRNLQKMDDLTKKTLKIGLIGGVIAGFISFLALWFAMPEWVGDPVIDPRRLELFRHISSNVGVSLSILLSLLISTLIATQASRETPEMIFLLLPLFTPVIAIVMVIIPLSIFPVCLFPVDIAIWAGVFFLGSIVLSFFVYRMLKQVKEETTPENKKND